MDSVGGRHHLDLCQSRTCIVWAVLFVTIPGYFPGPLLPYIFSMQWVVIFLVLCLPIPVLYPMPNRQTRWLKWDVAVSGLGTGCSFLNLTAQLHAIAGTVEELCPTGRCPWLCKSTCSCDQPSKKMQWEASSSWQTLPTEVHYIRGWEGRRNEGQRHKLRYRCMLINCYATCINFLGLYETSEPTEVYSIGFSKFPLLLTSLKLCFTTQSKPVFC